MRSETKKFPGTASLAGRLRTRAKAAPKRKQGNLAGRPTADELERRKARVMDVATQLSWNRAMLLRRSSISPGRRV